VTAATPRRSTRYRIDLTGSGHEIRVTMTVAGAPGGPLRVYMPAWTPGSYLIREFARHVDVLRAAQAGRPVAARKVSKDEWEIDAVRGDVEISYVLHAHELTVRTNYLASDRALVSGAATFLVPVGGERWPCEVEVVQPSHWPAVECALERRGGLLVARDYDALVDAPVAAGPCRTAEVDVLGVPHRIAVYGAGDCDVADLATRVQETCRAAAGIFGGAVPCSRYLFIIELGITGGLEHADSSVCGFPTHAFQTEADRRRQLALVAHEYFHLWNVKRIRPEALGPFDYRREVHTPHLWVSEGLTSWYQHVIELRAGHVSPRRYLTILASYLLDLERTPGQHVQSVEESSHDAWTKYYRPDAHSRNAQVSYYGKGAVVGLVLDLELRRRTAGRRCLDDVFRALWRLHERRPERGFSDAELRAAFAEAAGGSMDELLDLCARVAAPLPVDEALAAAGLRLDRLRAKPGGFLGAVFKKDGRNAIVDRVVRDSPAWVAGLSAGEELVALDGFRVHEVDIEERLGNRRPGQSVTLTTSLWGRLREVTLVLGDRPSGDYRIRKLARVTPEQAACCASWLGVAHDALELLDERPEEQRQGKSPKEL
jgi:predicted metalloprotease with PDZ domain